MPALAQASSCAWPIGAPLRPTPPIVSSPTLIGTPPPRNDIGKHPLPGIGCFGELRPLGGGPLEGSRGIGLAAGQFEIVRRRLIALEENTEPACAIDDSDRCVDSAFGQGRFSNRQGHAKRNVALRQHLRDP